MTAFSVPQNVAFETYDALVAAINDWLDREDLDGVAGQMIALAEDEMIIGLEPLFAEASTALTTVDGVAALPSDMKALKRVAYNNCTLPQHSASSALDIQAKHTGGTPQAYTLELDQIRLWPSANATVTLLYQPRLSRLTDGSPTNRLLSDFPSLYFYGAMVFAHGYVDDDQRALRFRQLFDNMLAKVARYYTDQRYSGPLVARVPFVP